MSAGLVSSSEARGSFDNKLKDSESKACFLSITKYLGFLSQGSSAAQPTACAGITSVILGAFCLSLRELGPGEH